MVAANEVFPTTFRIRCTSGDLDGAWLCQFDVVKGGIPFTVTNWGEVERNHRLYTLHPKFFIEETPAQRILSIEVAQVMQRLIKQLGLETEIVQS